MSAREERILSVARATWRADQPSEEELARAARRVERRMKAKGRPRPARRHTLILAFLIVFGGALAYAASGGRGSWFSERSPSPERNIERSVQSGLGVVVPTLPARGKTFAAPSSAAGSTLAEPSPGAPAASADRVASGSSTGARAVPAPAASWRAVDEALDAKDDGRATKALEGLAKSTDPTTRAKARLGLAQLARAKGDCAGAQRIATEVASTPGVDPSVVKRAQSLAAECQ